MTPGKTGPVAFAYKENPNQRAGIMSDDSRNSIAKVFVALFVFGVGLVLVLAIAISALTIPAKIIT